MHQLKIENITKRYGKRTVVEDLSFTVEPGLVTGFLGPNGAGKSTTMKILLDLAAADHGHTSIGGPATATCVTRPAPWECCSSTPTIPDAAAGTTCASLPTAPGSRCPELTRCWTWSASPTPRTGTPARTP